MLVIASFLGCSLSPDSAIYFRFGVDADVAVRNWIFEVSEDTPEGEFLLDWEGTGPAIVLPRGGRLSGFERVGRRGVQDVLVPTQDVRSRQAALAVEQTASVLARQLRARLGRLRPEVGYFSLVRPTSRPEAFDLEGISGMRAAVAIHQVDDSYTDAIVYGWLQQADQVLTPEAMGDVPTLDAWLHETGRLEEERILRQFVDRWGGLASPRLMVLHTMPLLHGGNIVDVSLSWGEPAGVSLGFDPRGARRLAEYTRRSVGGGMAIVVADEVVSVPRIEEPIEGGAVLVSVGASPEPARDARWLELAFEQGAVPAPATLEVVEVGPYPPVREPLRQ